jgi:organic hydroperoxide reductase OsmC/OhrA
VVRVPLSVEAAVDPEEAFVAALASCHMLWFLALAARGGFRVDDYRDEAGGLMGRNDAGRTAMLRVTLHPRVSFSGERLPSRQDILRLLAPGHPAPASPRPRGVLPRQLGAHRRALRAALR